jgi:hypothetical protein
MAEGEGVEGWFKALPPITRAYLVAALLSTFGVALGFVSVGKV